MKIVLKNLYKKFDEITAVNDVNVIVENGEFISILGPSGCGKSTLLFMISGLIEESGGEIFFDNLNVKDIPTEERGIGMVFQNYSLLQWRTVLDNIALGLEFKGLSKNERRDIARKYLNMISMDKFEKAYPYELSGGMQQRVAIARALAQETDIILADEPTGALDEENSIKIMNLLVSLNRKYNKTIIIVTHDNVVASFCDKTLYMKDGSWTTSHNITSKFSK